MLAPPLRPLPRALARRPRVVVRNRTRRLVRVVRALAARRWPEWAICARLHISRGRVRQALADGGGIWSAGEMARMRAAVAAERARP